MIEKQQFSKDDHTKISTSGILKAVLIMAACAAWLAFAVYGGSGAYERDLPGTWVQGLRKLVSFNSLNGDGFNRYLGLSGFIFFIFYLTVLLPDLLGRFVRLKGKGRIIFKAVIITLICIAAFISFVSCLKQSAVPKALQWVYLNGRINTVRLINSWLTPVSLFLIIFAWFIPVIILFFRNASAERSLRPEKVKKTLAFYGMLIVLELVIGSACLVLLGIADGLFPGIADSFAKSDKNSAETAVIFFTTVVLAPVIEEVAFRGLIQHHLKRVIPANLAIVISALCFGIWHRYPGLIIYTFFWGIAIGFVYNATGKIRHTILMHMLGNLLEVLVYSTTNRAVLGKQVFLPAYRGFLMGLPLILGVLLMLLFLLLIFVVTRIVINFATGKEPFSFRINSTWTR